MRLATARDELAPLRDPTVTGPDDPRLTILVLTRVIETLGDLELITSHDIEGLFAVDLAFLQDFYGVINFGSQEEYDALVNAQQSTPLVGSSPAPTAGPTSGSAAPVASSGESTPAPAAGGETAGAQPSDQPSRPALRTAVE